MTSPRRGSRRRHPVLVSVSALVIATGVVMIGALGGFAQAPEEPPPAVKAGEEIDQDLFRTTVVDAVVRTVPKRVGAFGDAGGTETVLDLRLRVANEATASVPVSYLERSLLRIVPPKGQALVEPTPPAAEGGSATPAPSPTRSGPVWRHDMFIPADGADSRLLPPQAVSTVVMRFPVRDGLTPPDRITIDFGEYELHEDWFTGRTRPQLGTDGDGVKIVKARVTVPVKRGGQ